ncbi:MAG: hypothetical protein M0R66_07095 [Candidatus Omnitrophica bacterium]|nr:hypothetical protein [Candidatus Omnitrophota bacterium]
MASSSTTPAPAPALREGASAPALRAPKTDGELRDIMKRMIDNPDSIADMDDEDIIELKQRINPIGTFAPEQKSYMVASIVNMKDASARQFMTTAMIGFIYRRLEEYVPDFVVAMEESYAVRINDTTDQVRRDALREECATHARDYRTAHKSSIRAFLDSIFLFNPDKHVRRAPAELPIDALAIITGATEDRARDAAESAAPAEASVATNVATTGVATTGAAATGVAPDLAITREAFAESTAILRNEIARYKTAAAPESPLAQERGVSRAARDMELATLEAAKIVYRAAHTASANLALGYRVISEQMNAPAPAPAQLEDARQLLQTCRARIDSAADILGPYAAESSALDVRHALEIAPPADVFYHFGRYIDSHYEVLRLLTDTIYRSPPGIENVIIYYDTFENLDRAKEYVRVHEAEFRADPKIIENGGVTVLGPFRENRDAVDFYNRHTEVLRVMMEQVARDHQIGKDLTKKKIVDAKRKNIRETGPDDAPGLERYIGARGIISKFGKKPSLSREEREQLVAAEQVRAEAETPDGALAMRVLAPTLDADGIPVDLRQSFFYAEGTNVAGGASDAKGNAPSATK